MSYSSIKIDMSKDADIEIKAPAKRKDEITPEEIKRGRDLSLCFWLGFILPIYGLIISAIIMKGDGVRRALDGVLMLFLLMFAAGIVALICCAFAVAPH